MTVVRDQLFPQKPPGSRFRFSRTGVQPSPGSSTIELPSAFAESGAYPPDREPPGSPRQCSLPLACRHPPEGHQIGAWRGVHLKTPSSANHTAAASQPTGRIAKAASWLHLSRVSPALLPPERPSHTHTPKPGFGGRGHDILYNSNIAKCHTTKFCSYLFIIGCQPEKTTLHGRPIPLVFSCTAKRGTKRESLGSHPLYIHI